MEKIELESVDVRYGQTSTTPKTWWQKLLFWKTFTEQPKRIATQVRKPQDSLYQTIYPKTKIYHQVNKTAEVSTNKDFKRECKYVGKLPSKNGVTIQVGEKYWYIIEKKDIESSMQ
ncbi:hypothetical protein KBA63_00220 [Candidatus Woesebacteria bacterium]|nr:hypothetical protein [Candidatus Woesebacteria bacterium]